MAIKIQGEYKTFKYYEGLCSAGDFPREIAKVLSLGVRNKDELDETGAIISEGVVLQNKNWDIVYPLPDATLGIDLDNLTPTTFRQKILNQVGKITDTVILKTRTTPRQLTDEQRDDLTVDETSNSSYIEMYLEIYKPSYIADPEQYPLDCERNGIIPKLITKEMWEESLQTVKNAEDAIYKADFVVSDKVDQPIMGSVELSYDSCDAYVSKLNAISGDMSFALPATTSQSTSLIIEAANLTKIKQQDADLYNFFLNNLNNNEGIEPKEYSAINTLTIQITKIETGTGADMITTYSVLLQGIKKLTYYSIDSGNQFVMSKVPTNTPTVEYYLDGIYIPIDKDLYEIKPIGDKFVIEFLDNIRFEKSEDGLLVTRYTYESDGQEAITERITMLNNHYVLMRLFDNINEDKSGPEVNIYNSNGEVIKTNAHVSPWSKLSWYQDFEEVFIDSIDSDVNIKSVHDGVVYVPLETAGLNSDTKLRYWINTNNDRFDLIVMGNPSLDYLRERHLVSGCYCGQINSFDNSINDTAGNFALFTSSSTEPCNTLMDTKIIDIPMQAYSLTDEEVTSKTYKQDDLDKFKANCLQNAVVSGNGTDTYFFQLEEGYYFNRTSEAWPFYIVCDAAGVPVTRLTPVTNAAYEVDENGKANTIQIRLGAGHIFDDTYTIYFNIAAYQEQIILTSGVTRDIFGNVVNVEKVKDYGNNTSDGVTSIMMYHTRSKAYYQKHHMMFATTEEYMSKVMYGKSSYTGEYYADRIKVTHGNDGPRGVLSDFLVIDSASLYPMDELVINKDFEKDPDEYEETFVYFPITAPFSPLSDSPNARYGLAIKKEEREPAYKDESKLVANAIAQLDTVTAYWDPVDQDIYPMTVTDNGCEVYWKQLIDDININSAGNTRWDTEETNKVNYSPVQLCAQNMSAYKGDLSSPIFAGDATAITITQGTQVGTESACYLKISGYAVSGTGTNESIMYGISDKQIASFGKDAHVKVKVLDSCIKNPEEFEYCIDGVPYEGVIGTALPTGDIKLMNAHPDKYLYLYSVDTVTTSGTEEYIIKDYVVLPLKNSTDDSAKDLLQYPCKIDAYISGGGGKCALYNQDNAAFVSSIYKQVPYDTTLVIPLIPASGFKPTKAEVSEDGDATIVKTYTDADFTTVTVNGVSYNAITLADIHHDTKICVTFETI